MTTTEKKPVTITMSDRAPLRIDAEAWPVIASALWFDGQIEVQANKKAWIKVREHEDGRLIVYGMYTSNWQGARSLAGGFLLGSPVTEEGTVRALRRVAGVIEMPALADECIGDLPAVELT